MLIHHQSGNRCQGLYRGVVVKHLQHGRLKVFVYGVYPEEYINQPDYLPICEQITPLWGGTYQGNGSFSYPNIGSTVFVQFLNDDVNYPVVIGATLGGQNAYHQYEQIKEQNEEISKKHMFTTGMAHFQMHESGKISSYVQQPFDNNVSIDFSNGDISCDVSAEIEQKINANEISHIVCQNVLDNELNDGEISSSTHKFIPIKDQIYLSSANEVFISTLNGNTQFLNSNIKNNLGETIDSQISSTEINDDIKYIDTKTQSATIAKIKENKSEKNISEHNISGISKTTISENYNKNINLTDINTQKGDISISSLTSDSVFSNIDINKINDCRNININKSDKTNKKYIFNNVNTKDTSTLVQNNDVNNTHEFNIDLNGKYKLINNIFEKNETNYLTSNQALKILSTHTSDNTYKAIHLTDLCANLDNNDLILTKNIDEKYIESSPGKNILYTLKQETNDTILDDKTQNSIIHQISNTDSTISTLIDLTKQRITNYKCDKIQSGKNVFDNNLNNNNSLIYQQHVESANILVASNSVTSITSDINVENIYQMEETGKIDIGHLSVTDLTSNVNNTLVAENHLTNNHGIFIDSKNTSTAIYNSKHEIIKNNGSIIQQNDFDTNIITNAGNNIAIQQKNFQTIGTISKDAKLEIITDKTDTKTQFYIKDNKLDIKCETEMSVNDEFIKTTIINSTTQNTAEIKMSTSDQTIIIDMDGTIPCKIELDSSTGLITLTSNKVKIKADNSITLQSDAMIDMQASQINIASNGLNINAKSNMLLNSASMIQINSSNITTNGNITADNGTITTTGNIIAKGNIVSHANMAALGNIATSEDVAAENDDEDTILDKLNDFIGEILF